MSFQIGVDGYAKADAVPAKVTDTDRLEFLGKANGKLVLRFNTSTGNDWVVWDQSNGLCLAGKGITMREAIDNAMTYKEGKWNE